MNKELAKVITAVLDAEKYLPRYIPAGCNMFKVGAEGKSDNFRYIAVNNDCFPLVWDGKHWELPSPLIVEMIYKALEISAQKAK